MRIFTEVEKTLLRRIDDKTARNLYSLITPYVEGILFTIDPENSSVTLVLERPDNLSQKLIEIQSIIIQAVNLIKLFEDKGYIFTFINSFTQTQPYQFGAVMLFNPTDSIQFTDPRLTKMFCDYAVKEIFVTPELNKFIKDGFITREEVRAKTQRKIAWVAIGVSMTAVLLNVIFNTINLARSNAKNQLKPDSVLPFSGIFHQNDVYLVAPKDSCYPQVLKDSSLESQHGKR